MSDNNVKIASRKIDPRVSSSDCDFLKFLSPKQFLTSLLENIFDVIDGYANYHDIVQTNFFKLFNVIVRKNILFNVMSKWEGTQQWSS